MSYRNVIVVAVLAILILVFGAVVVFAQEVVVAATPVDVTTVAIDWGIFVNLFLIELAKPDSIAFTILLGVVTWVLAKLPAPLQWAWRFFQIEQLLAKSLQAGINQTAGAVKGKRLEFDVANSALGKAVQYGVDWGNKSAIEWAGGPEGLRAKLIARMDVVEGAALK